MEGCKNGVPKLFIETEVPWSNNDILNGRVEPKKVSRVATHLISLGDDPNRVVVLKDEDSWEVDLIVFLLNSSFEANGAHKVGVVFEYADEFWGCVAVDCDVSPNAL